jgi:uncharacterized protein (UPF0335 family)
MAQRGKSNGNGQADGEAPEALSGASAELLDRLPNVAARIDSAKAKSDDARSDLGHIYHQAEEDGFHRRALKEAVRLRNMEPDKRNDYLASLNAYCDKLGVWDQGAMYEEPRPPRPPDGMPVELSDGDKERLAKRTAEGNQDAAGYTHEVGRQAGLEGKNSTDNPWPEGVKAHDTWHKGWLAGQEELVNGTVGKAPRKRRRKAKDPGGAEAQVH